MLPVNLIKYGILAGLLLAAVFYYGEVRYNHGVNAERVKCQDGMQALKSAIESTNRKAVTLAERQKESYRIGLDVRNQQYESINHRLKIRERELRNLRNETGNLCANSPIPDGFK